MTAVPLELSAEWEGSNVGSAEERACFAAISLRYGDVYLTEAEDAFIKRVRRGVHLSAYKLAEWLAWNWWRLRWEPYRRSPDWAMAHRMSTIGGGYVWPNVTIASDGERVALVARPTRPHPAEPLRYLADVAAVVPAADFEEAIDAFVEQVRGQLDAEGVRGTNLDAVWREVLTERSDPQTALRRKLEALLGRDPGEADEAQVERFIADGEVLGPAAVAELSAAGEAMHLDDLASMAERVGRPIEPRDAARLGPEMLRLLPPSGPAWRRGSEAARALRQQEGLSQSRHVSDTDLRQMAGVATSAPIAGGEVPLTFVLERGDVAGSVALRPRGREGQRFDLARLIGDRITAGSNDRLRPVTRAHTYRQKQQRAFAAEFLVPFEALKDMLGDDFSDEAQDAVAGYFGVSSWVVRHQLQNRGLLERDYLSADGEPIAA